MDIKLFIQALLKYILGLIFIGALLFLPAGTFEYWNAWLFMGLLFIPMAILGLILLVTNKELLKKRLSVNEKEKEQKQVIAISLVIFIIGFIISALDFRYGWSDMPLGLVVVGCVIFVISYILYAEVMRENAYLSRVVEIQENQKVVDTGLYAIVRHPMYVSAILIFLSMPIILGSFFSFILFCVFPLVLAKRIKNEEKVLKENLEGYTEYMKKVKYRLIPFIW